ncbi:MAG TPA: 5-carboxymethyl-2-hydroxymuconate isomerase, partial [Paraburkholderia sp.]
MPHLTLEYSANLANAQSMGQLCSALAQCLDAQRENEQRVYPLGGIRVRALRCEQYCIADGDPDAAFLHANLKIGAGRSE